MKTALVLGGGGARGLAHIGVLKVLERHGFRPDLIVGCSIGSIIGGMYAQTPDINSIEQKVREYFKSTEYESLSISVLERHRDTEYDDDFLHQIARNLFKRVLLNMVATRRSILKNDKLDSTIKYLIKPGDISETEIPFACNATDLVSGEPVLFTQGDIQLAIKASSSIPGYLPPIQWDSKLLVDGAVTYSLPVKFAQDLGAQKIISVNVKQTLKPQADYRNVFDILLRVNSVTSSLLYKETAKQADLQIEPDVGDFLWYDFKYIDEIIRAGEQAALNKLEELNKKIIQPSKSFWKRFFKSSY